MEASRSPCPRLYCGSARGQIVTFENMGLDWMESKGAISRWTMPESSSWFNLAAAASVAPPTKPERSECPSGARPGKSEEFRSEEHTSELQSRLHLVCRLLLEKKTKSRNNITLTLHTLLTSLFIMHITISRLHSHKLNIDRGPRRYSRHHILRTQQNSPTVLLL